MIASRFQTRRVARREGSIFSPSKASTPSLPGCALEAQSLREGAARSHTGTGLLIGGLVGAAAGALIGSLIHTEE
jgi:uncharacterized membrane protein YfcA